MQKGKVLLFLILFLFVSAQAQQVGKSIDSLKKCLNRGNDREQFKTLNALSDEYSNSDLQKAKLYAYQSLLKAKAIKNDTFVALAYNSIANVFQFKSELDSALFFHQEALKVRLKCKDSIGIADSFNNIGIVYDQKGQFPSALKYYFKALYIYEKKKDFEKQAMTNTNIGIVYKAQNEYKKALIYYRNAYSLYLKSNDDFGKTVSSGNLGSILIYFKNYKESLKYSQIAKVGYQKLKCYRFLGYPTANIAMVYDSIGQFDEANKNYIESVGWHEKFENGYEVADISNTYASCLIKQKKYLESISVSNKAIAFAKKAQGSLMVVQGYKNLAKAYSKLGDFAQAFKYSDFYITGKDSLFEKDKTKVVFELETKYQTEKKEKLLLQKEVEAKQKNTLLLIISTLAFFITLITFLIYRQQKLKNTQQQQEFQLKSAIVQIEKQNELQEQRLNISRDLHDNIGAQLTFIISSVDNIKYAFDIKNANLDNKLQSISSFTKSTIVELRDTIWAMNNDEIYFEDLRARILDFIEKAKIAKGNIDFRFTIDDSVNQEKLSSISGMNIYRTIQEAVNNAIKYANASQIVIDVKNIDDKISIEIQDNGIGFDVASIEKGNGLLNMQKRIEDIGGIFSLISKPGKGTAIVLLLNKEQGL